MIPGQETRGTETRAVVLRAVLVSPQREGDVGRASNHEPTGGYKASGAVLRAVA